MTKQEIKDLITNVIVSNDQKGITAESLANVLLDMVDATPEGGSGSSIPSFVLGAINLETGTIMPSEEEKAHNAETFRIIKESPTAICPMIDLTSFYEFILSMDGLDVTGIRYGSLANVCMFVPAAMAVEEGYEEDVVHVVCHEFGGDFVFFADGSVEVMYTEEEEA